jgi:hypothetical protein
MPKLELIEDEISRKLAEAERHRRASVCAELRQAPGGRRRMGHDCPTSSRCAFKILKNAGIVPPDGGAVPREGAAARGTSIGSGRRASAGVLRKQLTDLEQRLSLRLEALQRSEAL